ICRRNCDLDAQDIAAATAAKSCLGLWTWRPSSTSIPRQMPIGQWGNLMQIFAFAFALLLMTTNAADAQIPQIERIDFTEYGIYTVDREIQGRDAFGINKAAALNVRHAATIRTVPAQIGTSFGFRYK